MEQDGAHGLRARPRHMWVQALSRKAEGVDAYKIEYARDQDAFPDPTWPTRTLDELITVTFKDAISKPTIIRALLRLIGGRQNLG